MNILLIHNKYGKFSGEESVVESQVSLLKEHGHEVETYFRSSEEIRGLRGRGRSFFTGMYSAKSVREVERMVADRGMGRQADKRTGGQADFGRFDVVHIHNLYPLISPAILPVIKRAGIPIVMTVHNYRLVCPNGLFFTHGEICERCAGGREWNCILRNCEGSAFKSTGYALRNYWARRKGYYLNTVDAFLCLTDFQKNKLVENGFPAEKCYLLPNFYQSVKKELSDPSHTYALFAGRINGQKGFDVFAKAASMLPEIPFRVAGTGSSEYINSISLSKNIELSGKLAKEEMEQVINSASFLVFTSRSYEGFPMVFLEAMAAGIPVIAPNMAGFPEIIEAGLNGLLFEPCNAEDLAKKVEMLWNDDDLRTKLGENGRRKLEAAYSGEGYYRRLVEVYEKIITNYLPAGRQANYER